MPVVGSSNDNVPMPIAGDANANTSTSMNPWTRRLLLLCGLFFMVMIMRNVFFRDYTAETKSYLTSIGRADVIDSIIPKTDAELAAERKKTFSTFDQLVANMTVVMSQYQQMRDDIDYLKQALNKSESSTESVSLRSSSKDISSSYHLIPTSPILLQTDRTTSSKNRNNNDDIINPMNKKPMKYVGFKASPIVNERLTKKYESKFLRHH